jgi:hypothetical protein
MFANMTNTLAYCDWVSHKGEEKIYSIVSKTDKQSMKLKLILLHEHSGKIS